MYIIIDAYNFLKSIAATKHVSERIRHAFLTQLCAYATGKHHTILVVFDGHIPWPSEHGYDTMAHYNAIEVVYSGDKSADDYIKQMLVELKKKDSLLVSSDNELAAAASGYSIPSIEVQAFYHILKEYNAHKKSGKKSGSSKIIKTTQASSDQTDQLMAQAAQQKMVVKNSKNGDVPRHKQSKTLSKNELKLLEKIKKL
jgi:predicted RNA-binding protein with PIN domain